MNYCQAKYADIERAHQFPWFAQFKRQTLPAGVDDYGRFLASVGVDLDRQVDEIGCAVTASDSGPEPIPVARSRAPLTAEQAGGADRNAASAQHEDPTPDGDQLVGIALGQFDSDASEAILEKRKTAKTEWRGRELYACGGLCHNFSSVFLDSNTLAFGNPDSLRAMRAQRSAVERTAHFCHIAGSASTLMKTPPTTERPRKPTIFAETVSYQSVIGTRSGV